MSDVNILYTVTAVVLVALAIWVGAVLVTTEDAPDESPPPEDPNKKETPTDSVLKNLGADEPTMVTMRRPILDETPPPSTVSVEVTVPSERAVAIGGKSAPVVILPVMRSRLDSHSEIRDDGSTGEAPIVTGEPAKVDRPSSIPPNGAPVSLTSAIGRSEPAHGPTEMSAIVDRHRLFILADGGGQRVQNELVSAVVVNALAAAFEANVDDGANADPALPPRADRLRRAVLAANAALKSRNADGDVDAARVGVLAAHFSPDNRSLFIASTGRDRAYRLRTQEVVHLNKTGLGGATAVETVVLDTLPEDVYVFGSDAAFLALGDELRAVLTSDPSIDHVAAHFVAAATREGKSAGMTAIVVRVEPPRLSMRPTT